MSKPRRCERAIAFARWRKQHHNQVAAAFGALIGEVPQGGTTGTHKSQLLGAEQLRERLLTLQSMVEGATPIRAARQLCLRMNTTSNGRRSEEARVRAYDCTLQALASVIQLRSLAEQQVEHIRVLLQGETLAWRDRIYRKTQSATPDLVEAMVSPRGNLISQ